MRVIFVRSIVRTFKREGGKWTMPTVRIFYLQYVLLISVWYTINRPGKKAHATGPWACSNRGSSGRKRRAAESLGSREKPRRAKGKINPTARTSRRSGSDGATNSGRRGAVSSLPLSLCLTGTDYT